MSASRFSTRRALVSNRGSAASSGLPMPSQNRAQMASLATATTRWPSAVGKL